MEIVIVGAGASGMMAALKAAQRGCGNVTLIERQQRVGKKLLATGNGRCNLTNTGAAEINYHGEKPEFVQYAMSLFTPDMVREYFQELGLLTVEEFGGRVYPLSDSANSVVDVLRFALDNAGVELKTSEQVKKITRSGKQFNVETDNGVIKADRLVIACGGMAGGKVGGVKDGYELLESLGHSRTKLFPALVQLTTEGDITKALKGIRADCEIKLFAKGGRYVSCSTGEIQFTEKGISGPATFDISRNASCGGEGQTVKINLFRGYDRKTILNALEKRCAGFPNLPAEELLTGMLHNRLGKMLIKYSGISKPEFAGQYTRQQLDAIVDACFAFTLKIRGTESFDNAQVTAGGIKTTEFNERTMESKKVKGLFACGEVLDIDADCGGYNLQWAWASGSLAGDNV